MRRPEFIARQARCPTGWLGRLIVWIMARETAGENAEAMVFLDVHPTDRVLEIGFAHGQTLVAIAAAASAGRAVGIDVSADMVRHVARRYAALIENGRLEVHCADSRRLPFADAQFDKAVAIHTLYFWSDPLVDLREIARVMKPGGQFVLGFRSRSDPRAVADMPASVYRFYEADEVRGMLEQVGFRSVTLATRSGQRHTVFAVGILRDGP